MNPTGAWNKVGSGSARLVTVSVSVLVPERGSVNLTMTGTFRSSETHLSSTVWMVCELPMDPAGWSA